MDNLLPLEIAFFFLLFLLFSSSFYFPRFLVPESLNRDAPLTLSLEQRLSSLEQRRTLRWKRTNLDRRTMDE